MKVRYDNQQDDSDPMNGSIVSECVELGVLLNNGRREAPFLVRLSGDNGFELMIGIGENVGCVQYSRSDGDPPYLMAVSAYRPVKSGYVEFLTADTPTPIPARNILSFDELQKVVLHFLETGERSASVAWESV